MQDIILNIGELGIVAGDIEVGDSSRQHREHLLMNAKGSYKERPDTGVGLSQYYMDDDDPEEMLREVKRQFGKDGMKVTALSYNSSTQELDIKANYINE